MKLRTEQDGRLYRIALSSPETRNVIDAEGCRDLLREFHAAEADESVGAILLEADGHIFCAGCEPGSFCEIGAGIISTPDPDQPHQEKIPGRIRLYGYIQVHPSFCDVACNCTVANCFYDQPELIRFAE